LIFHLPWHPSHTLVTKSAIMNYLSYAISAWLFLQSSMDSTRNTLSIKHLEEGNGHFSNKSLIVQLSSSGKEQIPKYAFLNV
jgi:hypothetical protein